METMSVFSESFSRDLMLQIYTKLQLSTPKSQKEDL